MKNKMEITKDCLTCGYFIVDKNGDPHIDMWIDGLKGLPFNQSICFTVLLKAYMETKSIIEESVGGKLNDEIKKELLKSYEDSANHAIKYIKKDLYERN